jgi:hypothetical protein
MSFPNVVLKCFFLQQDWHLDPIVPFTPVVEPVTVGDRFLTDDPWKLTSDVPLIAGVMSSEAIFRVKCKIVMLRVSI